MTESWKHADRRRVVWRPSSREMGIVHNGKYWFVSVPLDRGNSTPRYWNSVGVYNKIGNLQIVVELNIPVKSNSRRVSGFFAKDDSTGLIYLMHDGAVGGGRKGVGQAAFLSWSGEKLIPVSDAQGITRLGILVAPITPHATAEHIARFAQKVLSFKLAVKSGEVTADTTSTESKESYDKYKREFSGKKKGQRASEFEYISRHGDIVHALQRWRNNRVRQERTDF